MNKEKLLKKNNLFAEIPGKVLKSISHLFQEHHLKRGESVIEEGNPGDRFYIITRGAIKAVYHHHHEHELGPGHFFAEMALLAERSQVVTAFALQNNTELLSIARSDFLNCLEAFPVITTVITNILINRLCGFGLAGHEKQIGNYIIQKGLMLSRREIWFLGQHRYLAKTVLIQMIPHLAIRDERYYQQLQSRLRVIASLRHPGIVKPVDVVEALQTFFIIYDEEVGITLARILAKVHSLPIPLIFFIIMQLAEIISFLHSQDIVHGDIRPENIFITQTGYLGLANIGLLHPSLLMLEYMSPEQLQKKSAGKSADIYALGVLTYLLATGKYPFEAQEEDLILRQKLEAKYIPVREINPSLPQPLVQFIQRTLEPKRAKRLDYLSNLAELFNLWQKEKPEKTGETDFSVYIQQGPEQMRHWLERKKVWENNQEQREEIKSPLDMPLSARLKGGGLQPSFKKPESLIAYRLLTLEDFISQHLTMEKVLMAESLSSSPDTAGRFQSIEYCRQSYAIAHGFFKALKNCGERKALLQTLTRLVEIVEKDKNYALLLKKEKKIKNQAERLAIGYNYLLDINSDQEIMEMAEKEYDPFISREKSCYVLICPLFTRTKFLGCICLTERMKKDLEQKQFFYSLITDFISLTDFN